MATSGSFDTDAVGSFYFTFEWWRTGYDSARGENYIHWKVVSHNTPGYYRTIYTKDLYVNGVNRLYDESGIPYYDDEVVAEGDSTIACNSSGDSSFGASFEAGVGIASGTNCSGSGSWSLDRIPRYSEINNAYVQSTGLTTAVIYYNVSRNANIYCSVDGQAWGNPRVSNTTSGTFTINNLSPNTNHNFRILSRAIDSGLDRVSGYFYGKTLDYARVTSASDSEYGNPVDLSFSNLANGTSKLQVKIGNNEICERTNLTANYSLVFSQEELSIIINLLKNENTEITYIVVTNDTYKSSKTAMIILKKNLSIKVDGHWKKSRLYIKVDGHWKKVKVYIKDDGSWRNTV